MNTQTQTLIFLTSSVGYLTVKGGLGKHVLEHRRRRRVCPSCGRQIHGRTCNGH